MHGIIHQNGTNVVQRSEWIEDVSSLHFPPFPKSRSRHNVTILAQGVQIEAPLAWSPIA